MLQSLLLAMALHSPVTQDPVDQDYNAYRQFQLKDLQRVKIKINDKHELNAWVMDTHAKRQEGMMFLKEKDFTEKDAMVFVFKEEQYLRFWMRNTYVPLDIAYVTKSGKANSIYTMKAFDETTDFSSAEESMYAVEVKAGLWQKLKVIPGSKIEIPDTVKSKD